MLLGIFPLLKGALVVPPLRGFHLHHRGFRGFRFANSNTPGFKSAGSKHGAQCVCERSCSPKALRYHALRCAALYFIIGDLCIVDPMYQLLVAKGPALCCYLLCLFLFLNMGSFEPRLKVSLLSFVEGALRVVLSPDLK